MNQTNSMNKVINCLIGAILLISAPVICAKDFEPINLYCKGGFTDSQEKLKEFILTIEPQSGTMFGFDPIVAIGLFDFDNPKNYFSKDFKCNKSEDKFTCSGKNTTAYSLATLNRYSGILVIDTIGKNKNEIFKAVFNCSTPPARKF